MSGTPTMTTPDEVIVDAVEGDRDLAESYRDRLPKASVGRSCVRMKGRQDVGLDVPRQLVREGAEDSPPGA